MATTVEVGNIQARITATTGRFDSAIRRVNSRLGSVKTSTKSLQDRIKSLNRTFEGLYQRLEDVARSAGRMQKWFGATLAAQTAAITVALKQAASYADEAKAVAGQTGIAVEAIQALNYAVQQSDGDIGLLNTGLRALARRSAEAAQGNRTFAKYFDQLGVKVQNLDGSMRPLEDILMDVADAVQALGSESEASAALMGLMGDAGRQLVPFMRQGSAGIRELMREARSLGLVLDREAVYRLSALSDQLNRTRLGLGAISREWALTFLPVAERIVSRIDGIVRAFHSLDDRQKELVFRFGTLTAAVMAGGFAFSTFLVILPQLVRGLQITMNVMAAFASPWVLGIAAIVAAVILLKRAWDQNLGGVQDKTESVTSAVSQAWENVETKMQSLNLDIPVPEWDKTIDAAAANVAQAWDEAKATIEALPPITLPEIEWPTIDTEPLKAEWERVRQEIAALEAPPIPAGVDVWIDRVADSLKRSPGGQVVLNIGELAREVRAGEKSLGEAVREAIESNIAIPVGAAAISLLPVSGGWKLALAGVALALSFIPGVDLEGLRGLVSEVWRQIVAAFRRTADVVGGSLDVSDPMLETVKQTFEQLGRILGVAVAETLIFLFRAVTLLPEFVSAAVAIGKFVAENFVGPFIRGFVDEFTKRLVDRLPQGIKDAWKAVKNFISGRDEIMIQVLSDPAAAARKFREATQDRQFQLRALPGYQSGTPWTGWGPLNEIAGVVHRQEAVIPADVLRKGPGAVLEFLGAPGFQGGKLGVPLGAAAVQAEADRMTQLNEESLWQLTQMSGILGGLSDVWDEAGAKLEQIASDVPAVRDLVELVRTLVDLFRAGAAPVAPPAGESGPDVPAAPATFMDRVQAALGNALSWLKDQGRAAGEKLAQFGSSIVQALTPIGMLTMLLDMLGEPVQALLMPITMVASALATALLPVFKATFPIIKTFGVLLLTVLQGVASVWNAIVGAIGNVFKSLSRISILGMRPLKFLEGTANFFLGLQVNTKALSDAQKELRDLTWEEATERAKNIDAIKKTTEALRNVPSGFKVALARFQAATPVQSFATGGYVPPTPGGRIVRVAEGGEGEYIVPESKMGRSVVVNVDLRNSTIYGVNDLDRRITTAVGRAMRQARMATYGVT